MFSKSERGTTCEAPQPEVVAGLRVDTSAAFHARLTLEPFQWRMQPLLRLPRWIDNNPLRAQCHASAAKALCGPRPSGIDTVLSNDARICQELTE